MIYYAGIGSRETPDKYLLEMKNLAKILASKEVTLRSGAASGADSAFELGCDIAGGDKEIYLPWRGFNNSNSKLYNLSPEAYDIAAQYHPRWPYLKDTTKKLMARNSYQIFGYNLNCTSHFVVCYTRNASGEGGTGQAIRIANDLCIPVFDFGDPSVTALTVIDYVSTLLV